MSRFTKISRSVPAPSTVDQASMVALVLMAAGEMVECAPLIARAKNNIP
jgi:hypothetical protein